MRKLAPEIVKMLIGKFQNSFLHEQVGKKNHYGLREKGNQPGRYVVKLSPQTSPSFWKLSG